MKKVILAVLLFISSCSHHEDEARATITPPYVYYANTSHRIKHVPYPFHGLLWKTQKKFDVYVTSKKQLKLDAARKILKTNPHLHIRNIQGIKVDSDIAEQPIGLKNGLRGANNRLRNALKKIPQKSNFILISIESYFETSTKNQPADFAFVSMLMKVDGKLLNQYALSDGIELVDDSFEKAKSKLLEKDFQSTGWTHTIGETIADRYNFPHDNWMKGMTNGQTDRTQQIISSHKTLFSPPHTGKCKKMYGHLYFRNQFDWWTMYS